MKATPWAALVAVILAGLCAFSPTPSSAQERGNAYAVAGVQVDETAANAAAAQQQGFAAAARQGFQRLFERLTLPADQARLGGAPQLDDLQLERLALSVDVEEERRSATRYIARLTVRFDADGVRNVLRQAGYSVVEQQAPPTLIAPVLAPGSAPELLPAWRDVWSAGGYNQELAPLVMAPPMLSASPDWASVEGFARSEAAATAIFAALRVQGSAAYATLTEVGPNNVRRERGEVSARLADTEAASLRAALASLADQANLQIQNEWKARAGAVASGPTGRLSASALYRDERQWEAIKAALEAAAATVISEIRIEAVGREGALISFSFSGNRAALGEELNRRGVSLEDSPQGPILRVGR